MGRLTGFRRCRQAIRFVAASRCRATGKSAPMTRVDRWGGQIAAVVPEAGREALAEAEGDKGGGVERQVYVEVIFVLIDNPAVQQSPEDAERLKAAVQAALMDKLREVIGWLGTASPCRTSASG